MKFNFVGILMELSLSSTFSMSLTVNILIGNYVWYSFNFITWVMINSQVIPGSFGI
jgi:hypothetical protein